mmetsp:Transcript_85497/g.151260  ORF Transcript_85497/g.151260 Transcript_85497/m.151260 type:complete len:869 (-) Transcript_85497:82-2688(-)
MSSVSTPPTTSHQISRSQTSGGVLQHTGTTLLPALSDSIQRRKTGTAQNDGLELCKQAVALLVADIRAEVQQAVDVLRTEAGNRAGEKAGQHQAAKLIHVAENLQNSEKDALRKLKDVLKNSNWELGQRLDEQMEVNAQLGDQIESSWDRILAVVNRLEVKMTSLEGRMEQTQASLSSGLSTVHVELDGVSKQIVSESKSVQQKSGLYTADLQKQLDEQLAAAREEINQQIESSSDKLTTTLHQIDSVIQESDMKMTTVVNSTQSLQKAASQAANNLHELRMQDDRHYTELGLTLETQLTDHTLQLSELKSSTSEVLEPVQQDIVKIRKLSVSDTKLVLGEIARIQKALHVDYVSVKDSGQAAPSRKALITPEEETDGNGAMEDMNQATRCRDYFTQTTPPVVKEAQCQTDPVVTENPETAKKKKKEKKSQSTEEKKDRIQKSAFNGGEKLKQQATLAAMKKNYNVMDSYYEDGMAQRIARHAWFDNLTLSVVFINAIWIAIDADLNKATSLTDVDPFFIYVENMFCLYFFSELCIRFASFNGKRKAFKDAWFVFDLVLVTIMAAETWIMPIVMLATNTSSASLGGSGVLKMIRLVRLLRLTRLSKILRLLPELVIILRGLAFAARSVAVFFMLWTLLVYVFGILFRQLTDGMEVGKSFFASVPEAMNTLLLHGVFASNANAIIAITEHNPELWIILVFFMALVSMTIMYMLVGVLVDVIGVVATSEKEKLSVSFIVTELRAELEKLGMKEDVHLTRYEFQNVMIESGIVRVLQGAGVDVAVLADMLDLVFEDVSAKSGGVITFNDLVSIVLDMRGTNPATVKDCKEQIRVTKSIINFAINELREELNERFRSLRADIQDIDNYDEDD